jgi:hypothetical protein
MKNQGDWHYANIQAMAIEDVARNDQRWTIYIETHQGNFTAFGMPAGGKLGNLQIPGKRALRSFLKTPHALRQPLHSRRRITSNGGATALTGPARHSKVRIRAAGPASR